jgi:hypothetical protein
MEEITMTQHDHEVADRGSSAVASVAIVVLVIIAVLAVLAFGGLNWLRNNGGTGGGDVNEGGDTDNPSVLPTLPAPAPTEGVPPAGLWSPIGAAASG